MININKIPTLIYSRTCGYFAPTMLMNKGKKEEFAERKMINIEKAMSKEK